MKNAKGVEVGVGMNGNLWTGWCWCFVKVQKIKAGGSAEFLALENVSVGGVNTKKYIWKGSIDEFRPRPDMADDAMEKEVARIDKQFKKRGV